MGTSWPIPRDVEILNLELVLADIEVVERRLDKARKNLKGDKKYCMRLSCSKSFKPPQRRQSSTLF
jgi:ribosome-binding ATPase YchF (GTP1/OBG family)